MTESQPEVPASRRLKKRYVLPGLLFVLLVAALLWVTIRGTWADTAMTLPSSSAEGIITRLVLRPDGHKEIRCAAVFDAPLDVVWNTITDYDRFPETFSRLSRAQAERRPDGRFHLRAEVDAGVFGTWPFEADITHEKTPGRAVASWDGRTDRILVNRGSWTLTAVEDRPMDSTGRTLVVYALEVEVASFPAFFVRAVLRCHLRHIVAAVRAAAQKR